MPDLTARFSIADQMSSSLEQISQAGMNMVDKFEQAEAAANSAFDGIRSGVTSAVSSVDGVATSIDKLQSSAAKYGSAASDAASQTDYWTSAVGNYDKSLLEAVNSTEELVAAGFKTADALEEQNQMVDLCEASLRDLSQSMEATSSIQNELERAMRRADSTMESANGNEKVSVATKNDLADASEQASQAMQELQKAQKEADEALEAYNRTMDSGTANLNELEAAAEKAGHAAENLAEANGRATTATAGLNEATNTAAEASQNAGETGVNALEMVSSALATAGITEALSQIAQQVYSVADSFSEAEKIIAGTTGATGEELRSLQESAANVFAGSNAESLSEVASGMTAVQRTTGLAGEALEEATSAGILLNDVLGYDIPESSRTASTLMSSFGLTAEEAYNLIAIGAQNGADRNGDLLDVLTEYAPQYAALGLSAEQFVGSLVNGAEEGIFSMDKLADAVKEFNTRAKDGSDTTAQAFETLGMSADVMAARFAAGGETASTAFFEVVNALNSLEDPVQRNQTAINLFGTQFEDLQAKVLPVLASIQTDSLETYDALERMNQNAQSMSDHWQKAGNAISTAFGNAVTPALEKASNAAAGFVEGIGNFLTEYPVVTKVITAFGVGLGTVVAGITAVTFATKVAIPQLTAFGAAISSALGPVGLAATIITGVVAGGAALVAMLQNSNDEVSQMTATTRAQYNELQDLNAEYERACEESGKYSEEASRLKYEIDELSASFEENRQTVEEFQAEVESLVSSNSELISEYNESMSSIDDTQASTFALAQKMQDLASKTSFTVSEQQQLKAVVGELNELFPELGISYEKVTASTDAWVNSVREAAEAQAEQARQQQQMQTYVDLLQKQAQLEEEIAKAEANLTQEYEDQGYYWDERSKMYTTGGRGEYGLLTNWLTDIDEYRSALEELEAAYAENQAAIAGIEEEWGNVEDAVANTSGETISYQEAAATAYQSVQSEVEELAQAYQDAYETALESFQGQFGLFDEASTSSEEYLNSTVANAQAALESQLSYWTTYQQNISALKDTSAADLGITQQNYDTLMSYVQSGSEEAAGLAASMVQAINSGNSEAVAELANTLGEVNSAQSEIASTTAEWQTGFTEQMNQYAQDMNKIVTEDLELSEEARTAATSTINSYVNAILAGKANAVAAAQQVAAAVSSALASASASAPGVSVSVAGGRGGRTSNATTISANANGTTNAERVFLAGEEGPELVARRTAAYATGTTNSEDYFIAGERGPELIVGEQGSTVFPTSETNRLIEALNEKRSPLNVMPADLPSKDAGTSGAASRSEKKIILEIAGSGAIQVSGSGGADKTTILDVLTENLKPVLMNIIQGEIYEEGELSYDY